MIKTNTTTLILVIAGTISLSACGGGGGGQNNNFIAPTPDTSIPTIGQGTHPPINIVGIESFLAPSTTKVNVGVVDSGVKIDHFRIRDSLIETHISSDSLTIDDVEIVHGTPVAQIIANGTRNENLFISKALNQNTTLPTINILNSTQWLNSRNVRVINYSIAPLYFTNDSSVREIFTLNRANNVVSVVSAGNRDGILSINGNMTYEIRSRALETVFDSSLLRDSTLFVGSLGQDNNLRSYSYFPGERSDIQSRFLVVNTPITVDAKNATAPNQNTIQMSGTSAAAPVVTAAVTNLIARWPALTAQQATDLILQNTDRTFTTMYAMNNCGETGNVNCGLFTFGQGRLDMLAALRPLGTVSVAMSSTVGGPSVPLSSSNLVLPSAFGDATRLLNVETAVFDSIGRDFVFNIGQAVSAMPTSSMMRTFENRLQQEDYTFEDSDIHMKFSFAGDILNYGEFGFKGETFSFNFIQNNDLKNFVDTSFGDYLSFNSKGTLAGYQNMNRFGFGMDLSPTVHLYARTTNARTENKSNSNSNGATRQELGFNFNIADDSKLTIGYEVTNEDRSMFGLSGNGAFSLNNSKSQAFKLQLINDHKNGWTSFGMIKTGTLDTSGSGLLASISNAKTSEFATGFTWQGLNNSVNFMISQPLRVDSAKANFNVATGRTLNGYIKRENVVANLRPSGRQINMEVSYQHKMDDRQKLNIYALYKRDVGHIIGNNGTFIGATYRLNW